MEAPILSSGLHWRPEGLELCSGDAPDSVRFIDAACEAPRLRQFTELGEKKLQNHLKIF